MKRRSFVKTSMLTGSLTGMSSLAALATENNAGSKDTAELYELRTYTLKNAAQQSLVEDYYQHAAIPALNKMGSKTIGVFTEQMPEGQTKLFVLVPYKTCDDFMSAPDKLMQDATYVKNATAYLQAPATEPAYERIESSLLKAFAGMPVLQVPGDKPRIFELRQYQSATEAAGKKKIQMFNEVGEIAIFKRVGLTPVFFGETLIGSLRPNLTYMLTFDNMAEHDKRWGAFVSDAEWNRIKAIPGYEDANLVSKIVRTFLVPVSFSQI